MLLSLKEGTGPLSWVLQGQALLLPASEECLLRIPSQIHHYTPRLIEAPAVSPDQIDFCKGSPCRQAGRRSNLTGKESATPRTSGDGSHRTFMQSQSSECFSHVQDDTCHSCTPLPSAHRRHLSATLQAHLHWHTAPPPAWPRLCPGP